MEAWGGRSSPDRCWRRSAHRLGVVLELWVVSPLCRAVHNAHLSPGIAAICGAWPPKKTDGGVNQLNKGEDGAVTGMVDMDSTGPASGSDPASGGKGWVARPVSSREWWPSRRRTGRANCRE